MENQREKDSVVTEIKKANTISDLLDNISIVNENMNVNKALELSMQAEKLEIIKDTPISLMPIPTAPSASDIQDVDDGGSVLANIIIKESESSTQVDVKYQEENKNDKKNEFKSVILNDFKMLPNTADRNENESNSIECITGDYKNLACNNKINADTLTVGLLEENAASLTEKSVQNSINLQRPHTKTESVLEYLNSVEPTVTEIHEKLIDFDETPLLNDSESEEDDQLKPLMTDNHTTADHHEYYVYENQVRHSPIGQLQQHKYETNKGAFSSTDSDLSTQYDHRDLTTMSQNSDDYKDSGLDTLSSQLPPPPPPASTPVEMEIIDLSGSETKEIDTLSPMEIPDDRLCEEIVESVEYYFSNESILKDAFLLKHVRRNKEGFVSLKLVSSFKRVRQFTKDWRVVGYAIRRKSKTIELNDLGTKIRRLEPLPSFDETMPSRTIVACDLPFEKLSIDKITDIFSKCGEIALIRILRPGMPIPVDVRQFMNKYPEMQQKECALVEYIDSSSARFAKSMQGNFQVYDMVAPKKKTGKKSVTTITKFIENYKYSDGNMERSRGGGGNLYQGNNPGHVHYNQGYNNYNHGQSQNIQNNNNPENDFRYKVRYNNSSEQFIRGEQQYQHQHQHQHQQQQPQVQNFVYQPPHMQQRRYSTNSQENSRDHIHNMNNMNNNNNSNYNNSSGMHFTHYPPRRASNCSMNSNEMLSRKYSSCSEGYSSCSEHSRRPSLNSSHDSQSRKTSSCSEHCSSCSRRTSQCSDVFRKISQTSDNGNNNIRRFSNGSFQGFDRTYSNPNDMIVNNRRISFDSNYDRKISSSSIGNNNNNNNGNFYENPIRKFSNGFDPNRKLSNTDQYFNGRRISTDSGYDRRLSFSSDISTSTSPRSRTNSFIAPCQHKTAEAVVRTPIGPDGSKGFASRTRKTGQVIIQPVN